MIRKAKTMTLAIAGCLMAAALLASGAAAKTALFHSASAPVNVTATQMTGHVFTINAGTWTCKKAHFTGTRTSTTGGELTMALDWNECTAFGFVNVPIHENGCHFTYTAAETTAGGTAHPAVTHLVCPGKPIEITAPFCTTTIGPQTLGGHTFSNNAGKTDIVLTTNVTGIAYNECGTARTNGTYKGTTTIIGSSEGAAVSLWYE